MTGERDSLVFDPYPLGCPVGLVATPEDFQAIVPELVMRMHDVFKFSVHVVEPSRGQPYPLLNILRKKNDPPSLVFFPAGEDAKRKRRVNFKRQSELLSRIHKSSVPPERVEDVVAIDGTIHDDPLVLRLACTAAQMPQAIEDLHTYVGDKMRVAVQTLNGNDPIPLRIVRLYAMDISARIIAFPGWRAAAERAQDAFSEEDCYAMLERTVVEAVSEVDAPEFLDSVR